MMYSSATCCPMFTDSDCDAQFSGDAECRGWAMRRGHRKRLAAPNRGRAARIAEISGQGHEVYRGRSVFKRTVNSRPRAQRPRSPLGLHHHTRRRLVLQGALNYSRDVASDPAFWLHDNLMDPEAEEDAAEAEEEEEEEESACTVTVHSEDDSATDAVAGKLHHSEERSHGSSGSSTTSSVDYCSCLELRDGSGSEICSDDAETCRTPASSQFSVRAVHGTTSKTQPTLWDLAVLRAELAANAYAPAPRPPQARRASTKKCKRVDARGLAQELSQDYNTHIRLQELASRKPFDRFRRGFLQEFGKSVCANIRTCIPGRIRLRPANLDNGVAARFLALRSATSSGELRPAFHGTDSKNIPSICKRGLIVPKSGSGIRVANGSAHGVGIYTARVGAASLSWGFCQGQPRTMLICGVIDDADMVTGHKYVGRFTVTAESASVRHVGDAMVIFESCRVAPLFTACQMDGPSNRVLNAIDVSTSSNRGRRPRLQTTRVRKLLGVVAFLSRRAAQKRRS